MRLSKSSLALIAYLLLNIGEVTARDSKVIREFKREVPCPTTGKRRGVCPGYQADHVVPLCLGGADDWRNMQWLTLPEHADKTRDDVRACAAVRRDRK